MSDEKRFVVLPRSEADIIEDEYAVTLWRVADSKDVEEEKLPRTATVAYCRTRADAEFVANLMNVGDIFREQVKVTFKQIVDANKEEDAT